MTSDNRGSIRRKWDLHVHTPLSIEQHYGENNETTRGNYISDLESLPQEFSVLGINDYLFLDGYEKILQEKKDGSLKNIDLILPVLEFRIEKFAGIQFQETKRINLHVIFSNELSTETIKSQFLNTLEQSYTLENGNKWTRAITRSSLSELGKDIKSTIPKSELHKYGSDLKEGFNNLNIDEKQIFKSLDKDCFKGKYLIAIGKTEWDELKRSESSIATKKSIINDADIVFTSSESIANFNKAKEILKKQKVNNLLLDCSDAHNFSSATNKDRIGKCFTRIKADPTFEGLKQILYEPDERIYIGEQPEIIERVCNNKTKYIQSLKLDQVEGYDEKKGIRFKKQEIELNKELVAIIGNKGNGKSALADILGFLGNTHNGGEKNSHFSFLNKDRFMKGNLASNFEGELIREDGETIKNNLGTGEINLNHIEKVRYLPQNYFNNLTNEIESKQFTDTLESVIFNHLDESLKLGKNSFKELREYKTKLLNDQIEEISISIKKTNIEIIKLERKKQKQEIERIKDKIALKQRELGEQKDLLDKLNENKPKDPCSDMETKEKNNEKFKEIEQLNGEIKIIDKEIEDIRNEKSGLEINKQELSIILAHLTNLQDQISRYKIDNKNKYLGLGINIDEILELTIKDDVIKTKIAEIEKSIFDIGNKLTTQNQLNQHEDDVEKERLKKSSIIIKKDSILAQIEDIKKDLSKIESEYQTYLENKNNVEKKRDGIVGDELKPDTLKFYENQLHYLTTKNENGKTIIQEDLEKLERERLKLSTDIFTKKQEILDLYKEFKKPIDNKVEENKDFLDEESRINIDVKFVFQKEFPKKFLDFINQGKRGSFNGRIEGENTLSNIINSKEINKDIIETMLKDFLDHLYFDKRDGENNEERIIFDQVNDLESFYNYIFSLDYIDINYELKAGEKVLQELSPGEKGTILLIFYLMIDKEGIPLIIDQPEDNLDNQSVFKMLSTFIKKAKKKRQIIIVTHNPNLAVGADAEQIIYTQIDKVKNNEFSYISGSIENPIINKHIVNILEGTMPAFDKRKLKYQK